MVQLWESVLPHTSGRCYQNFQDPELPDWANAYYGDNLGRLVGLKAEWDPDGVFDHDQGIPAGHVDLMKREIATGKSGSELVVYPDTHHGFHADYRPMYKKEAAEDGWKRLLEWFKKNGVG